MNNLKIIELNWFIVYCLWNCFYVLGTYSTILNLHGNAQVCASKIYFNQWKIYDT